MAAKSKKKGDGAQVYAFVIDPNSVVYTGPRVACLNRPQRTDPKTGEHYPEKCVVASPNSNGVYVIGEYDEFRDEKIHHMNLRVANDVDPILGPFDSMVAMAEARERVRPKTPEERLEIAEAMVAQYQNGLVGAMMDELPEPKDS